MIIIVNLSQHLLDVSLSGEFLDFYNLFQKIENYQKPTWPTGGLPQQAHMDFHAKDLDIAEKALLEIGAVKAEFQPKPHRFRIYLDPAGHPFCMVQNAHD